MQLNWFSWDIGTLAGTAALAFTIHTTVGPMIKCSKYQNKNRINLAWTFFLGYLVYSFNGVLGYLGVLGKTKPDNPVSILAYFPYTSIELLIVEVIYMTHLLTMFPIIFKIFRMRFFEIFFTKNGIINEISNGIMIAVNIGIILLCFIVRNIPDLPSSAISNFNGSISCFFLVYLIPIAENFACYYGYFQNSKKLTKNENENEQNLFLGKSHVQEDNEEDESAQ